MNRCRQPRRALGAMPPGRFPSFPAPGGQQAKLQSAPGFAGALALAAALLASCAGARPPSGGLLRVGADNDSIAGRDEGYTSGLQLGWVDRGTERHADGPLGRDLGELLDGLPGVGAPGRRRYQSVALAHRMYTPAQLSSTELIEGDVPYSAQLTATFAAWGQGPDALDALSFTAGVLGPGALGREVQNLVHEHVTGDKPLGWRNQLENEPLAQVAYEHRRRLGRHGSAAGLGGDLIALGGAGLGNYLTHATFGLALRYGWRVPDDLAVQPPYFGEDLIGTLPWTRDSPSSLHAVLGLDAAWIGYHAPWDGNLWRSGPSVDYDPYLTRMSLGVVWRVHRWRFDTTAIWANVPFENELGRTTQVYGRFGVGYRP
jgi:lipid A 3-O-deacylase